MDFSFSAQDEAYRREVQSWLRENAPGGWRDRDAGEAMEAGGEPGSRAHTIFAGTSEIQRNIIAERVLGLPRA